jgi:hypothetical protein
MSVSAAPASFADATKPTRPGCPEPLNRFVDDPQFIGGGAADIPGAGSGARVARALEPPDECMRALVAEQAKKGSSPQNF